MGYMGFGMRKELRKKPNKVFSKLKKVYGERIDLPKPNIQTTSSVSNHEQPHRFKALSESRFFKIAKVIGLIAPLMIFIWVAFIQDSYLNHQKKQFEDKGFRELYLNDLQHIKYVFGVFDKVRDKIVSLEYNSRSNDFKIVLKHPSVHESMNPAHISRGDFDGGSPRFRKLNEDAIDVDILVLKRKPSITYQDSWVYTMKHVTGAQIPVSVMEYLGMNELTLFNFMLNAAKLKAEVKIQNGVMRTVHIHPDFGAYHTIYSTYELKPDDQTIDGSEYRRFIGKLDHNIYWSRLELINDK